MKKTTIILALCLCATQYIFGQDTLWVRYDDRFKANGIISLVDADSMEVRNTMLKIFVPTVSSGYRNVMTNSLVPTDEAEMTFSNPGRYLLKPNTYAGTDYTNADATSGYNFAHSLETDHYAVFWDVRFGENPAKIKHPDAGSVANANTVINVCERCWDKYVELGFLVPGKSTTDKYKIQLYIPYQSDWRADASGTEGVSGGKTGIGHFNPWAASIGTTVAHEVGHTFQYLVSADLGMTHGFNYGYGDNASGGNGWWESCANWQAYKVFPNEQFSNNDFYSQLNLCHLNLLNEEWRYQNFFIQDWWCMKHGTDFIGRLWRESVKPEDPVEAYIRLCDITQQQFNDEMMEGAMRMATWDIDGVRDVAKARIGEHKTFLNQVSGTTDTWQADSAHCIQNYGYAIINMNNASAGTVIKAHFKGIAGSTGYRSINIDKAGWRYAFVAYTTNGERVYGDVQSGAEGTATLTVPSGCKNIFFVVLGAPTQHWHHPWDDNPENDEQWPYQVRFENINIAGK